MARPQEDDFIQELKKVAAANKLDPCDLPKLVVLKGYYGLGVKKNNKQKWRIYLNHALTDYYEGDDARDVLHWQKLPDDEGALVWIKHDLPLRLVRSRALEAEIPRPPHPLLTGPIAEAHLPAAPAAGPRWIPGYHQGPSPAHPGFDWDPYYELGWEGSKCSQCGSASP